jgi:hypothetical protein
MHAMSDPTARTVEESTIDLEQLESGLASFRAVAAGGDFASPDAEDDWTAETVIAHVIVTHRTLAIHAPALLLGETPMYDGRIPHQPGYLAALISVAGDWNGLLEEFERGARELIEVSRTLDPASAGRPFDFPAFGSALSFQQFLDLHGSRHLPSHAAQLEALRRASVAS